MSQLCFCASRRWRIAFATCAVVSICLFAVGCSDEVEPPAPIDKADAQTAMNTALAAWKNGDSMESLRDGDPSILVSDEDWLAGAKLTDFKIGKVLNQDGSQRYEVELSLVSADGRKSKSAVAYIVSPGDVISVMREFE